MKACLKLRKTSFLRREKKTKTMKNLSFFNKLLFILNSLFVTLLLLGYVLPYMSPNVFPRLSVLSLLLPVLIVINFVFVIYWLLRFKRQFWLSALVLLLGVNHITGLYNLSDTEEHSPDDVMVLSYNLRSFSIQGLEKRKTVQSKIYNFIKEEDPDIICFQEYSDIEGGLDLVYPYQAKKMKPYKRSFGQIIYSKYPIIHSGSLDFKKTSNNIIYADVVIKKDTVRVYNVHLQSLRVSSQFAELQQDDSKRLVSKMGAAFKRQQEQVEAFLVNEASSLYPVIVAGDFNNSSTSYIYRKIKGEKEDAFAKAGSGTGRTFTFDFVPLRIDFVLADPQLECIAFETYSIALSDHEPIRASFKFGK